MSSSDARHKIIRSKEAKIFLRNLAASLNLSGIIHIQPLETSELIEIPITSEETNPTLQHIVEAADFKLICNYPPRKRSQGKT